MRLRAGRAPVFLSVLRRALCVRNHAECRLPEDPQAVPARWQPKNAAKLPSRRRRDVPEPRSQPGLPNLGPGAGVVLPKALWLQRFGTETLPRYHSWVAEGPGGWRPVPGTKCPHIQIDTDFLNEVLSKIAKENNLNMHQ